MYKQKLHELCQKKKWRKPEYFTVKDGSDHSPRFESSVTVNGVSFNSPSAFNSSRKSQNDAAKIAFLNLNYSSNSSGSEDSREVHDEPDIQSNDDSPCQFFKNQLENYAQWKHGCTPLYHSRTELPSHSPMFNSTFLIYGHTFECPGSFKTMNLAENATAEFMLLSIAEDNFEEDNPIFYKNLLQEMGQRIFLVACI